MHQSPLEKRRFFEARILDFFEKSGRAHLPWRVNGISAYEVWVSEIMLQQTQVSRVIEYYRRFLERFPTVHDVARASWEEFLPYYAGLGYYVRGRSMLGTARRVVAEYGGVFPREVSELEKLPGIGAYTASAIASFAYGENTFAWDTNLRRIVGRFFFGTKFVGIDQLKLLEKKFSLPAKTMNAALMDFGTALCGARPKCTACPLVMHCIYFRENGNQEHEILHTKKEKKQQKNFLDKGEVSFVVVFLHENHKEYFSSQKNTFQPFFLVANRYVRADIKAWFREKFSLDVSVRPPHAYALVDEKKVILVHVQILAGVSKFRTFPREDIVRYNEENIRFFERI